MSRWRQLAQTGEVETISSPDSPTKGDKTSVHDGASSFCQVLSGCQGESAKIK